MKKISIIVPVYNTGEYLHKCIKSILAQTLEDFELIIINDGSIDNSGDICDEYANLDSRVKVVHKVNEGVSVARNVGISLATGEYIGFVDSDDWIDDDMYANLYNLAESNGTNIVMCDTVGKYENGSDEPDTIIELNNDVLLNKSDISADLLRVMAGSACRCIYKRSLIIENNILFPVNVPLSEDRIFNIYAFGYSSKIYYTKFPYYKRFMRKGSAVHKYYDNMCDMIELVYNGYMEAVEKAWHNNFAYLTAYNKMIVNMSHSAINNAFYKTSDKTFVGKFKKIKEICNNNIVQNCIKSTGANDIRSKLLKHKKVILLGIIAIISNKRHNG